LGEGKNTKNIIKHITIVKLLRGKFVVRGFAPLATLVNGAGSGTELY